MAGKRNLVSVIMPIFNAEKYVEDAINSVRHQTYLDWELLIVNDCSTDRSGIIAQKIASVDSRIIYLVNEINLGSGFSRNLAIEKAKGTFIAFLDSDDIWHPEKLKIQINFMIKNKIAFSHTSYGYINENDNKIKETFHVSKKLVNYYHLLKRTEISCLTAVYNCKMIGKFYMSNHRRKQDYALWLKILKSGYESYPIDIELAYYRQSKVSATSNKWLLIHKHILFLMETQQMNFFTALYYTFFWSLNGFYRYYLK
jgi:teichuronic acid biosynthesis glycosyltransferase TuaG